MDGPVAVALNCQDLGHLAHDETKGAVVKVPSVFNMGISSCYPPGEAAHLALLPAATRERGEGRGARHPGRGGQEERKGARGRPAEPGRP